MYDYPDDYYAELEAEAEAEALAAAEVEAMAELEAQAEAEMAEIEERIAALLTEYEEIQAKMAPLQARMAELRAELKDLMTPGRKYLHNGKLWSYVVVEQKRLNTKAVKNYLKEHPEYADKWYKTTKQHKIVSQEADDITAIGR